MSRAPETLDDLIDRVAADLTHVPLEAGYGERLVARLDRTPSPARMWTAVATAATVAIVAVALWWAPRAGPELSVARTGEPGVGDRQPLSARDVRDAAAPVVGRAARLAIAPAAGRRVLADRARTAPGPSIPALEMPAVLAFDELAVEALLVPAVGIERLDVSTLAIDDMESVPDSKEHP